MDNRQSIRADILDMTRDELDGLVDYVRQCIDERLQQLSEEAIDGKE